MHKVSIIRIGEQSILLEFGKSIDEITNREVLFFNQKLIENPFPGFIESVPSYATLTIYFDFLRVNSVSKGNSFKFLKDYLEKNILNIRFENRNEIHNIKDIPVIYNGQDLEYVASFNSISVEEVIKLHTEPIYKVYMMGFVPGFSYLGGLNSRIVTPRKSTPQNIKAGSVAIGGEQTGVYSLDSVGGWQVIGHTEIKMFSIDSEELTYLNSGDLVRFISVN